MPLPEENMMNQLELFQKTLATESSIPHERIAALEGELEKAQRTVDFEVHEYSIDFLLNKFLTGAESDENEIYVPDYQRELVWPPDRQARFIESIFLGLPIPFLFVGDTAGGEREGFLEIIDGVQRLKTLANWTGGNLVLKGLKLLPSLNGLCFGDLPKKVRFRFLRKTVRLIEVNAKADDAMRRELFDRLNSGGMKLEDMEQRRGTSDGIFLKFVEECAAHEKLRKICPLPKHKVDRREYEELVLRFFAYLERHGDFKHDVARFLDSFLKDKNKGFDREQMLQEFERTIDYVARNFMYGFAKNSNHSSVPRVRFEAIAVGIALALRENPNLPDSDPMSWLTSKQFETETTSHASNSGPRLRSRLFFVRDSVLGRAPQAVEESEEDAQWELA